MLFWSKRSKFVSVHLHIYYLKIKKEGKSIQIVDKIVLKNKSFLISLYQRNNMNQNSSIDNKSNFVVTVIMNKKLLKNECFENGELIFR